MRDDARLAVLTSMSSERATTNPYVVELNRRLSARVTLTRFSWRALLFGAWDVFHVHWPEVLVGRTTRLRTFVASLLLMAGVARARLTGRRIVRTLHNVTPHERQAALVGLVLRAVDSATSGWIRLTERTPVPREGPAVTIPHGTYTEWFADAPHPASVPGRVLFAGMVRPYKGVEDLLQAFASLPGADLSLRVCGRAQDPAYAESLGRLAAADPRVSVDLRHLPDVELSAEVGRAELVVLPYRELHNSGIALLALSLSRPVLVPANDVTLDLRAEVGATWVQTFDGQLDGSALGRALAAARAAQGEPDLSARSWDAIADAHVALFERVLDRAQA